MQENYAIRDADIPTVPRDDLNGSSCVETPHSVVSSQVAVFGVYVRL